MIKIGIGFGKVYLTNEMTKELLNNIPILAPIASLTLA